MSLNWTILKRPLGWKRSGILPWVPAPGLAPPGLEEPWLEPKNELCDGWAWVFVTNPVAAAVAARMEPPPSRERRLTLRFGVGLSDGKGLFISDCCAALLDNPRG